MMLYEWAHKWRVPYDAIEDLRHMMRGLDGLVHEQVGTSEAAVQANVRVEASRKGARLWRNNVGALETKDGAMVRYGLANDSSAVNARVKSSDLIGVRPILIEPCHVGTVIGQFIARECKHAEWVYTGSKREQAQEAFLTIVNNLGGDGRFCTGPGTL